MSHQHLIAADSAIWPIWEDHRMTKCGSHATSNSFPNQILRNFVSMFRLPICTFSSIISNVFVRWWAWWNRSYGQADFTLSPHSILLIVSTSACRFSSLLFLLQWLLITTLSNSSLTSTTSMLSFGQLQKPALWSKPLRPKGVELYVFFLNILLFFFSFIFRIVWWQRRRTARTVKSTRNRWPCPDSFGNLHGHGTKLKNQNPTLKSFGKTRPPC